MPQIVYLWKLIGSFVWGSWSYSNLGRENGKKGKWARLKPLKVESEN